ncbi:hypothetical protein IEQ34_016240 [Dendrobium chrysotoxum]|uniref:Uncharacterized protein n=1 Tax=Dendrobium chrysotoxum TaxID=161865 RepID=A0AAV7GCY9_DENCH|nr:hypothetical protein IEQ34_016240 [Dendrobium chrysotoxum]
MVIDLLEEFGEKATLRKEEVKRRIVKYYNSNVKEKAFQPNDPIMKKVDEIGHDLIHKKTHEMEKNLQVLNRHRNPQKISTTTLSKR